MIERGGKGVLGMERRQIHSATVETGHFESDEHRLQLSLVR